MDNALPSSLGEPDPVRPDAVCAAAHGAGCDNTAAVHGWIRADDFVPCLLQRGGETRRDEVSREVSGLRALIAKGSSGPGLLSCPPSLWRLVLREDVSAPHRRGGGWSHPGGTLSIGEGTPGFGSLFSLWASHAGPDLQPYLGA